jgi:2-keto-4-pentenoate hydratase
VKPLQDLADRQWRDYRARQPGTCFADPDFVLSLADAYELQDAVAKLRVAAGDRLIGYKVGCTGTGTVQQFGMQGPIRGCLFKSEIRKDGDVLNSAPPLGLYPVRRGDHLAVFVDHEFGSQCSVL